MHFENKNCRIFGLNPNIFRIYVDWKKTAASRIHAENAYWKRETHMRRTVVNAKHLHMRIWVYYWPIFEYAANGDISFLNMRILLHVRIFFAYASSFRSHYAEYSHKYGLYGAKQAAYFPQIRTFSVAYVSPYALTIAYAWNLLIDNLFII